jgi:uncharacterized iron-regulated protein
MNRRRSTILALGAALATAALGACVAMAPANADSRLAAALRSQPVVLLGEVHDNAAQHALRARTLDAWLAGGARPALLMEQFDRERQPDIDRVLATQGASADDVIAAAAPAKAGWDWALYRPLIALALKYRLPLIAANVSRTETRRAIQDGLASIGFDAQVPPDIAAAQAEDIRASHCGAIDAAQAGRMVPAQEARDQWMARLIEANAARGVVLLAGNGHVRRDIGVPRWLAASTRAHSVAIGLLEEGTTEAGAFDVAIVTPAQSRPDPCEAFRAAAGP